MTRTNLASVTIPLLVLWAAGCGGGVPAGPASAPQPGAPMSDYDEAAPPSPVAETASAPSMPMVAPASTPPPPPPPRMAVAGAGKMMKLDVAPPAPVAGAGPVTPVKAGEWDDNANYREFQKWLGTEAAQPYHRVDARDRQFLVVRDADGKAIPRCPVVVSDAQQHQVTLTTTTSGRALLFPHAEGLVGQDFSASTSCQGGSAGARFSFAQGEGVVDLHLAVKRALPAIRDVDLGFVLDTTGSMAEEIAAVKSTIQKVSAAFDGQSVRIRVGMVEYKDRTDPFVTKVYPMTTDTAAFSRQVGAISAGGGGDMPESVNEGLHVALNGLVWSPTAIAHFAFLIGDAPPHLDYPNDFDYAVDMKTAAHQGIQVFTVAASGMDDLGQVVWRQIAQYTGATNLFVLRGGAGPQSTGAGDPKSSCGGTQTQFVSGNLDALIVRKVNHELKGLDRDPLEIAGLRVDENAKPCAERLKLAE